MEKMTYSQALSIAIDVLHNDAAFTQACEKLEALQDSLAKRSAAKSTTPSKASREAAEFAETVLSTLTTEPMKCGDIAKMLDVSGQKVAAALSKLVKAGRAVKTTEKGVSLFSIAED